MLHVKTIAPAKVNLFLGIGPARKDGYHDVATVLHALSLHDVLDMTLLSCGESATLLEPNDEAQPLREFTASVEAGSGLSVRANMVWREGIAPVRIEDSENLACRAVRALAEELGRAEDEMVNILMEKHIPPQAGLGGGSADAAAALVGAAHLWGVPADDPALARAARRLGADVAFFLHGGCALMEGRGDVFVRSLSPSRNSVVVLKPEGGVSTAQAYAAFDAAPAYPGEERLAALREAQTADDVVPFNNLQGPACGLLGELSSTLAFARGVEGVRDALLCGSGSAVFCMCENFDAARRLQAAAQLSGLWARATSFSGIRAAVVPKH